MAEEIGFENGRNSNYQGFVDLTLTLDPAIPSCITHRPLPTYQISLKSEFTFFESHHCGFVQVQSHMTQQLGQISTIRPDQISILCSSLRISGHLPAPILNGAGERF